jgi:hypothetical protein
LQLCCFRKGAGEKDMKLSEKTPVKKQETSELICRTFYKKEVYMIRWAFFLLLASISLYAQDIEIKGKVTNKDGKAIYGAIVSIESMQVADTTDTSGAYSLIAKVSAVNNISFQSLKQDISLKNSIVNLNLTKPSRASIEIFNMNGKLLYKIINSDLPAGVHRFDIKEFASAQTMALIRVSIDKHAETFRYTPLTNGYKSIVVTSAYAPSEKRMAKLQEVIDSLQASALGYKTKKVPVNSLKETIDIVLETADNESCTPSKTVQVNVSVSGPHRVTVETNSDHGINEGTIYRPADLGPGKKYPIFVWGNGACSRDGTGNSGALAELASHGYLVISDGTPGGSGSRPMEMSDVLLKYVDWAIAQNRKPCSPYYQSLDTTKIASNGFSCGGMLAMGTAHDPRMTTWGLASSGSFSENRQLWDAVHTPVLILEGHNDNTGAYNNGLRDYNGIAPKGHPIMFFSHRNYGHGGDLWSAYGGEFTKIMLAWLNWWLKDDLGTTGKGYLVGSDCKYCKDSNWEVKSANIP